MEDFAQTERELLEQSTHLNSREVYDAWVQKCDKCIRCLEEQNAKSTVLEHVRSAMERHNNLKSLPELQRAWRLPELWHLSGSRSSNSQYWASAAKYLTTRDSEVIPNTDARPMPALPNIWLFGTLAQQWPSAGNGALAMEHWQWSTVNGAQAQHWSCIPYTLTDNYRCR
ncbi:hypothetical protein EAI_15130 [Harpegnathos saltator]|uniref:Uncharacterized protein n=1 Tax=Harpegnathos saltator TaxID=610380 RepID=E2BTP3_HARSA|nr:hypothetical protein EAI_15130 [Harpegnathos saltator]